MKKIKVIAVIVAVFCLYFHSYAQEKSNTSVEVSKDSTPIVQLPTFYEIYETPYTKNRDIREYNRLEEKVKKVYPYALLASYKLQLYNDTLSQLNSLERKIYMKRAEKELKKTFGSSLRDLSISEGRILIRLIDRQTGNTSYQLVKQLRGSFPAFFWQTLARFIGDDLKSEYNPKTRKKDEMIERIIYHICLDNGWTYVPYYRIPRVQLFSDAS